MFAVEFPTCRDDLWQPLDHYLYANGYLVVRVSPLSTYHARVLNGNDFSRTDPKDALIIATNASNGSFVLQNEDDLCIRSMRTLSITSDKLRRSASASTSKDFLRDGDTRRAINSSLVTMVVLYNVVKHYASKI